MKYGFLTDMVGLELRKAQTSASKKIEAVFGKDLLSGHFTVLVIIRHNPGQTQSAIAQAAGLDRSTLVPLLKQFEKRGLITRKKAEKDARSNVTAITPAGEAYIKKIKPMVTELEQQVAEKLGPDKYGTLVKLLKEFQEIF